MKIDTIIYRLEMLLGGISMACIAILVFATVICRYVFKTGILWADEVVVNLFVLLVMMGGAMCFRFRKHTEMTLLFNVLPKNGRIGLRILLQIVVLMFLLVFLYSGIMLVRSANGLTTSILRIPMAYIYAVMPVGTIFMLYEFLKDTMIRFRELVRKSGAEHD